MPDEKITAESLFWKHHQALEGDLSEDCVRKMRADMQGSGIWELEGVYTIGTKASRSFARAPPTRRSANDGAWLARSVPPVAWPWKSDRARRHGEVKGSA